MVVVVVGRKGYLTRVQGYEARLLIVYTTRDIASYLFFGVACSTDENLIDDEECIE